MLGVRFNALKMDAAKSRNVLALPVPTLKMPLLSSFLRKNRITFTASLT